MNPLLLAMACGASFVARGFSRPAEGPAQLMLAGIRHSGLGIIDVYSPCPTFNKINTFKSYREEVAPLPADDDRGNYEQGLHIAASTEPRYLGGSPARGPSYDQLLEAAQERHARRPAAAHGQPVRPLQLTAGWAARHLGDGREHGRDRATTSELLTELEYTGVSHGLTPGIAKHSQSAG